MSYKIKEFTKECKIHSAILSVYTLLMYFLKNKLYLHTDAIVHLQKKMETLYYLQK